MCVSWLFFLLLSMLEEEASRYGGFFMASMVILNSKDYVVDCISRDTV